MSTHRGPGTGPPADPPRRTSSTSHDDLAGELPTVLTAREVAAYLRVNYNTVLDLTKAGQLPAMAVGREHRYLRAAIDDTTRHPGPSDLDGPPDACYRRARAGRAVAAVPSGRPGGGGVLFA